MEEPWTNERGDSLTVPVATSAIEYAGNDVATAFSVPFAFQANTDLVVTLTTDGVDDEQTLITDYTVSGAGGTSGTVTMVVAPPADTTLRIERVVDLTQEINLRTYGDFSPATHEAALDKLTMAVQQVQRDAEASTEGLDTAFDELETSVAADIAAIEANVEAMSASLDSALELLNTLNDNLDAASGDIDTVALTATQLTWTAKQTFNGSAVAPPVAMNNSSADGASWALIARGTGGGNGVTGQATTGAGIGVLGQGTSSGYGVYGSGGTGVRGDSSAGIGVDGQGGGANAGVRGTGGATGVGVSGTGGATSGIGVTGLGVGANPGVRGEGGATSGPGLVGIGGAPNGRGVMGVSAGFGTAVYGDAISGTGYAGSFDGNTVRAPLRLTPGAEPTGPNLVGDIYVTAAGVLKICTVAGTPGTWVSVGSQ